MFRSFEFGKVSGCSRPKWCQIDLGGSSRMRVPLFVPSLKGASWSAIFSDFSMIVSTNSSQSL